MVIGVAAEETWACKRWAPVNSQILSISLNTSPSDSGIHLCSDHDDNHENLYRQSEKKPSQLPKLTQLKRVIFS